MGNMANCLILVLTIFNLLCAIRPEPACSKYDYEEKLLSKLIRMEIKMDDLENIINKSQTEMADTLSSFKENRDNAISGFAKELDDFKLNMLATIKTEIDELRMEREQAKAELKKLESMRNNVSDSIAQAVSEAKDQTHIPDVHFAARNPANKNPSSTGEIFRFQTVLVNVGGGYDDQTGIFTAPVSGMYAFSLQVCSNDKYTFPAIVKENSILALFRFYGTNASCSSSTVYTRMDKGERVSVKCGLCSTSYEVWEYEGQAWNMFSGVLMYT